MIKDKHEKLNLTTREAEPQPYEYQPDNDTLQLGPQQTVKYQPEPQGLVSIMTTQRKSKRPNRDPGH